MFAMALGPFRFSLPNIPIVELSQTTTPRFASHAVGKRVPVKQFLGPDADLITLSATIYPNVLSPAGPSQLAAMRQVARAGTPMAFLSRSGPYLGMFVIEHVGRADTHFMLDGSPEKITVDIEICEWGW